MPQPVDECQGHQKAYPGQSSGCERTNGQLIEGDHHGNHDGYRDEQRDDRAGQPPQCEQNGGDQFVYRIVSPVAVAWVGV
ncbi:MAG: hypothetical protein LC799_11715 [Actinobacteria bacterium]|nr:hypothetical protein [Actinomycetota bacterium]